MFNFNYLRRAFQASKYGKIALIVLFAGLVMASAFLAGSLQSAAPADAASFTSTSRNVGADAQASTNCNAAADLTYTSIQIGGSASASITNNSTSCTYHAGLASYRVYDHSDGTDNQTQPFIMTQQLHRTNLLNIAPGQTKNFSVALPSCAYQVDLFEGPNAPVPPSFGLLTSTHTMFTWEINESLDLCGETQLPPPVCSPSTQTVQIGQNAYLSASGGSGSYGWSSPGGSPSAGVGSNYHVSYSTAGTKTVTVNSNGQTDQCHVTVQQPPSDPPVYCSPTTQTVGIGENANFTATGGNGSFSWTSSGNPASGSGSSFHTSYSTAGTKTVTVTSGSRSAQCTVIVPPVVVGDISCSPLNQNVNINETASLSASGGDGAFHWTASGGSPSTGNGQNFQTAYNSVGYKYVLVNDNSGHTAQCNVQVNSIAEGPVCNPSNQNVNVDENAHLSASGGNGTYFWSVSGSGASDDSGTGSNFNTSFSVPGTKTVTVTSNGLSDSCTVFVNEEDDDLSCSPSNQDVETGDWVTFRANGGSGTYRWTADDADPDSDTGRTFTTQFDYEGNFTIRVRDSAGHTATCRVDVEDDFTPRRPSCSPSSQDASVNEQVEFYANGGTGNYEWTARDGSRRSGFGSRFITSFDEPGRYTVRLESNGETDTCEVDIDDNNDGAPFCSPSVQNANVNDFVTFSASGGNGNYSWSTSADGSPSFGSGSSFGTRFVTPGNKFVIVSSNGRTSQCLVQIGSVLGASTVITGPTETAAAAAGIGFLGALGAYGAIYRERSKKFLSKLTRLIRR